MRTRREPGAGASRMNLRSSVPWTARPKFVRGDAIAGLMITFINIIGGMIIGVGQNDLSMYDAGQTYTLLTVGDGLVSQIPALIVSTAAGLLVSKAGVDGAADEALLQQLSGYPKALGMSSFVMLMMAALPGIPVIPFLGLAATAGGFAYFADKRQKQNRRTGARSNRTSNKRPKPKSKEPPISEALHMDELRLELGYGLLPMINDPNGDSDKLTGTNQSTSASIGNRYGLCHAVGQDPRQHAVVAQRLCLEDQGSRSRTRIALRRSVHGYEPHRRTNRSAGHANGRTHFRPSRHLGRFPACATKLPSRAIPSSIRLRWSRPI